MKKLTREDRVAIRKIIKGLRQKEFSWEWIFKILFEPSECLLCKIYSKNDCVNCPLAKYNRMISCHAWSIIDEFWTLRVELANEYMDLFGDSQKGWQSSKEYQDFKKQCYKVADWLGRRFLG